MKHLHLHILFEIDDALKEIDYGCTLSGGINEIHGGWDAGAL